jgi:pectate lyase
MRKPTVAALAGWVVVALFPGAVRAKVPDWKAYAAKGDEWYRSHEGATVAANVLANQTAAGSWPKNVDTTQPHDTLGPDADHGTFDNGATTGEVRFLARAFRAAGRAAYRDAALKAVDHVLAAQYPNGGWPQFYPPGKQYHRHITFNDNTMVRLMELLREVAASEEFAFAGDARRAAARKAFDAGVACILKAQVEVDGKKTVWCAQHDEVTLAPRPARTFEPVSLSGGESAGILLLLMSLDHPSAEVMAAVDAGARWYEAVKLTGIRQVFVGGDKRVVPDKDAPPLWARFYEIGTNRPLFCGRDGVVKYDLASIERERRNGYAWYGNWGAAVAKRYALWKAKLTND